MLCVICALPIGYTAPTIATVGKGKRAYEKATFDPAFLAQTPYCPLPKDCGLKWRTRQPFLFKVEPRQAPPVDDASKSLAVLQLVMSHGADDETLARLRGASKPVRTQALYEQAKPAHKPATHFDKSNPGGVAISADEMLEIAILAYHGALELKAEGKPVILYRIAGKKDLSTAEKMQTLSGRIRVKIGSGADAKEVWPLEKTSAWIQGALRARVSFLLLNDPRGDLLGGKDGTGDAVYVREIFQILGTGYEIAKAADDVRPAKLASNRVTPFILQPKPGTTAVPLPLIPKMARGMQQTGAWDGAVDNLKLEGGPTLIRDDLQRRFKEAAVVLGGVPVYA